MRLLPAPKSCLLVSGGRLSDACESGGEGNVALSGEFTTAPEYPSPLIPPSCCSSSSAVADMVLLHVDSLDKGLSELLGKAASDEEATEPVLLLPALFCLSLSTLSLSDRSRSASRARLRSRLSAFSCAAKPEELLVLPTSPLLPEAAAAAKSELASEGESKPASELRWLCLRTRGGGCCGSGCAAAAICACATELLPGGIGGGGIEDEVPSRGKEAVVGLTLTLLRLNRLGKACAADLYAK